MGEYAYAGQYGQSPIPAGGGMFRTALITIHNAAPHMKKLVRYWDKAASGGKGCWTVGVKMGVDDHGVYWVLDVVRGQWESYEREKIIKQTATADGRMACVQCTEQEGGSGGKESAQNTVRNLAGFRVRVDRPVGDKVMRADPLASQINGGNMKLVRGAWNAEYLAELQFFPFSKFKDQVDASSGAFAMITGIRKAAGGLGSFGAR
jgi:predicted phage terminase large subunit-like protein